MNEPDHVHDTPLFIYMLAYTPRHFPSEYFRFRFADLIVLNLFLCSHSWYIPVFVWSFPSVPIRLQYEYGYIKQRS